MSRRSAPWVLVGLALVFLLGACSSGGTTPPAPSGDQARGGLMYDKWWTINGATEPTTDHPAYPAVGQKSGSTTWRCKECHGWDYLGAAGAYGDTANSHFTGIAGVLGAANDPQQTIFDAIKSGPNHDFSAVLSDDDVWDLVAFIANGLVTMQTHIDPNTDVAQGDAGTGRTLYDGLAQCSNCHGLDGFQIDFGGGDGVVHVASDNPWETLHKIRWGHPGTGMPSGVDDGLTTQQQVDILAHSQTLLPTGASAGNGGLLYDKWWVTNGGTEPTADHPAYPIPPGQKSGSTTWRCKECHGWDYLGAAGAYGDTANSHFTGLAGVMMARNDFPPDLFDAIQSGPNHDFSGVLSDADVWDLVAFTRNGTLDMQTHIDPATKVALGDPVTGRTLYEGSATCSACHGVDGYTIDFGGGDGVADVAVGNPWEGLHKIRWGHPGTGMPSAVVNGFATQDQVDILAHSQTLLPTGANAARGGLLYDKWWVVNGATEPTTDHPAYPTVGQKSGSTTWRCKECHGWDYLGAAGAYGDTANSHYTGLAGVLGAEGDPPRSLFDAIKSGTNHDFSGVLNDADVWDLVAFVKTGTLDMQDFIDPATDVAQGNAAAGQTLYQGTALCSACHGTDGKTIDFGGGDGVGDVAVNNPWEGLHKIRWGHPGTGMPSAVVSGLTTPQQVDILTHSQTLPTVP